MSYWLFFLKGNRFFCFLFSNLSFCFFNFRDLFGILSWFIRHDRFSLGDKINLKFRSHLCLLLILRRNNILLFDNRSSKFVSFLFKLFHTLFYRFYLINRQQVLIQPLKVSHHWVKAHVERPSIGIYLDRLNLLKICILALWFVVGRNLATEYPRIFVLLHKTSFQNNKLARNNFVDMIIRKELRAS